MSLRAGLHHGVSRQDSNLFVALTRDLLQRGYTVRFRAAGISMHPAIQNGELLTVVPQSAEASAVGDVLLCRCGRGPTAHRVVSVQPSSQGRPLLTMHGDNLSSSDGPIPAEDVIGRVLAVRRGGSDRALGCPGRIDRLRRMAVRWLFAAAIVLATVMGASDALAQQTRTWTGNVSTDWIDPGNWAEGLAPVDGDDLVFPPSANLLTNNGIVNLSVNSITIRDSYTIGGSQLAITGAAGVLLDGVSSTGATINLQLRLIPEPTAVTINQGTLELFGIVHSPYFVKQGAGTLLFSGGANNINILRGEAGCGQIRATEPQSLGAGVVGRVELDQNCTLSIEADTTFDKPIFLNGGTLVIAAGVTLTEQIDMQVDAPATINVFPGATLDLPDTLASLRLNASLTVNVGSPGLFAVQRSIAGPGGLIKEGDGFFLSTKVNTYTGDTIIRGGFLEVQGVQTASAVILDGGTLSTAGTTGTISATARGGTISVGIPSSDRADSGSVTMNVTTTFEVEFEVDRHDELFVEGTVALNGARLSALGSFPPTTAAIIIDNDLTDAVIGTFAGLPQNARIFIAGVPMRISYTGGTGNDVVVTPEVLQVPGYEVLTGTYVGNQVDFRAIKGLGFQPALVIIKATTGIHAVARDATMTGLTSKQMGNGDLKTDAIESLDPTGFTVGTNNLVNQSGVTYQWVAWKAAPGEMSINTYIGNGLAGKEIVGLGFSPEIVFVFQHGPDDPVFKVSTMVPANEAFTFDGGRATNYIISLDNDGFTVGNNNFVNRSGTTFSYVAWNATPGTIKVGSYPGAATAQNITGVGFQPDFMLTQRSGGGGDGFVVAHSTAMGPATDTSQFFSNKANKIDAIELLRPDGFQVGTAREANESGRTYFYAAWGRAAPTAVRMAAISARRTEKGVVLEWRTGYEADNLGFHVYRGPVNRRVRLTSRPLIGSGLLVSTRVEMGAGHTYRWIDETAGADAADVEDWVEEIDLNGTRTWHGPIRPGIALDRAGALDTPRRLRPLVELTEGRPAPSRSPQIVEAATAPPLSGNPPAAQTETAGPPRSSPRGGGSPATTADLPRQWSIAAHAAVKIDIASAGWYRVTQPALVAAGLAVPVNPSLLHLFVDGVEQPLRVKGGADGKFGRLDSVEFYATGADTPYTGIRTYWIVSGGSPGQRIPVIDGRLDGVAGPSSFPSLVELKPRSIFFGALMNGDKDNFFGPLITPGEATVQIAELTDVIAPAPATAEIEVALQGVTDIEHVVGVRVNGIEVGEVTFAGRDAGVGRFAISQALLVEGANAVSLDSRGGELDYSLIDYIRLTYHRRYRARENRLTFSADGGQRVVVSGFSGSSIRVIDITGDVASHEVTGKVSRDGAGWKVTLTVPDTGPRTLIAVATDAAASPVALRANVPSALHRARQSADIIMIAPAAFRAALRPLKAFRERQRYTVRIVDIEDVYDEFNYGGKDPRAIRDFLVHAAGQWSRPPRFLLLVGNATQDPRDYYGFGEVDHVPAKVIQTGVMEAASDDWFVDADEDGFADMAIVGRLPARSVDQVAAMVSKIIAYEQGAGGSWRRSVLLVSDRDDAGLVDYAALTERVRPMVPDTYQVTHIRRVSDPDAGAALKARLSEGAALVSYQGHGSVAAWRLDLLTTEDVPGLTNGGKLPVVVALNCFNGMFQSLFPEESLAEALVRAPDGGAVGVWASSGMTSPQWQWRMNLELYRQIFQGGWLTIGEAMRAAKETVGDPDVRSTWIYFGDPASRFARPSETPPTIITVTQTTQGSKRAGAAASNEGPDVTDPNSTADLADSTSRRVGVRLADFNADGRDDMFLVEPQSGLWFSAPGNPGDFSYVQGQWSVAGEPIAVDLNGDGGSDLFVYDPDTGNWLQAMSTHDGRFITHAGSWQPGYRISTGDFDGDGREEVFAVSAATGAWFQAVPDGRGAFRYRSGAVDLHDADLRTADFNGDARDDVWLYDAVTGRWTLRLSGAGSATFESGNWGPGLDVTPTHLNDDGHADLFVWDAESGRWAACLRNAAAFACSSGAWPAGGGIQRLDRDGDGRDELLRYDDRTGSWTLTGVSATGEGFRLDGVWEPGWSVASGDLDGDGRDDLALYNPETGRLIKRLSRGSAWQDDDAGTWPASWLMTGRQ